VLKTQICVPRPQCVKLTQLVLAILLSFSNMTPSHYVAHYTFILVLCHLAISNVQIIRLHMLWISKGIK